MKIPAPSSADMTAAELATWREDMAILEGDPRTAGGANRPAWLVVRVLRAHRAARSKSQRSREALPTFSPKTSQDP